ncbi:MAG: sensor histidine kinase [Candidatus Aureabacteria bacterium]|nr:sensor histidine kinase [Candidatus Auribacterota bacterium]
MEKGISETKPQTSVPVKRNNPFSLAAMLRRKIEESLAWQLLFIFFWIVFIIILSHALLIRKGLISHVMKSRELAAKQIVSLTAHQAGYFVIESEKKLQMLKAVLETAQLTSNDMESLLVRTSLEDRAFGYLSLFDRDGKELYCSEPVKKGHVLPQGVFIDTVHQQISFRSEVGISREFFPVIFEAWPVSILGKTKWVLYAEINLKGLWEYLDTLEREGEGHFFMVSDKGVLCSYKERKFVMRNEDEKSRKIAESAILAIHKPVLIRLGSDEQYLLSAKTIQNLPFYLVYQEDMSLIMNETSKISFIVVWSSLGILVLSLVPVVWASKRISRPVLDLVANTKWIGDKYLNRMPLMEKRKDEIGTLFRAFYDMNEKVMESKARERMAVIGESAVGISHEIKNPITAIKNFISLMIENPADPEVQKEFKKAVPREVRRIEGMLEDLSSLSLVKKLDKRNCTLDAVLDDVFSLFDRELKERRIQYVKNNFSGTDASLNADPERLKSVFINLLQNSIASMPEGGLIQAEIRESEVKPGGRKEWVVTFEDNGSGIPPQVIGNIFNPFFTTKKKGLGIGLTLSKGIIEQHGGSMSVFSEGEGKGALFTIMLPV